MFSKTISNTSKLIECSFIVGIPREKIQGSSDTEPPSAECLLCFPDFQKSSVNEGIIDLIFPTGIKYSYTDQSAKFNSITLTNEQGTRSYIYILKLFENAKLENKEKSELRVPLAICIRSMICDTEAFRCLLQEVYTIITYNCPDAACTISSKELGNYKQVELLNFFMFINSLLQPPSHTLMTLNLRFSSIDFYFSSKYEIPCTLNDNNIKNLFSCLEMSMIIKLWFSILTEKRIIIVANQSFLLYSICEALLKLIFPFKWLHTYVPVLPTSRLDYLDAPIPYIMGVLSSSADFVTLEESYPDTVICDVDSCQLSKNTVMHSYLPQVEETLLRKKIQMVKNPELFKIEDSLLEQEKSTVAEDVNPDFSFSENVQKNFFRIIRNCLEGYKKSYLKIENINEKKKYSLDEEKFLTNISCEEYKKVWEKIIKTTAFENFILFNQFKDDSYTKIFNNIIKYAQKKDKIKNNKNAYRLEITLPKYNIKNLLDKIKCISIKENELETILNDYFSFMETDITEGTATTPSTQLSSQAQKILSYEKNTPKKNILITSPLPQISIAANEDSLFNIINAKVNRTNSCDYGATDKLNRSKIKDNTKKEYRKDKKTNCLLNIIKLECFGNSFAFYHHDKHSGFITFAKNIMKTVENDGLNIIDISIKLNLHKEIYRDFCYTNILNKKDSNNDDSNNPITEANEEHENQEFELTKNRTLTTRFSQASDEKVMSVPNNEAQNEKYINIEENLKFSFQYYLFLAFYLEEILASDSIINALKVEKEAIQDILLSYYENAFSLDKKEFPLFRYTQNLDALDLRRLNKIKMSSICEILKPLLQLKIQKLTINLTSESLSISKNKNGRTTNSIRSSVNTDKEILTSFTSNSHMIDYSNDSRNPTLNDTKDSRISFCKNSISPMMTSAIPFGGQSPVPLFKSISISPGSSDDNVKYLVAMKNQMKEEIKKRKVLKTPSASDKKLTKFCEDISRKVGFSLTEAKDEISQQKVARETVANCTSTAFHLDSQSSNEKKTTAWYSKKPFEEISQNSINKPAVLNLFMKVNKKYDPIQLINEIGSEIISLVSKYHLTTTVNFEGAFIEILSSPEMEKVMESVACLQKVNIAKFSTRVEKLSFWLNVFNFLVLFAIIYKRRILSSSKDWNLFLRNSLFNIGGYEISLYEIENKIIGGNNFHGEEISLQNELLKKFMISKNEDSFHVNLGISLPTSSFPYLKMYNPENIYYMLTENAKQFLTSHITLNADMSTLQVSEYILLVEPNFLVMGYIDRKNLLSDELFNYLSNKAYERVDIIPISWITNFSDVII